MDAPNRMNFRKSSKGGGVIFNPKIYVVDFGNFKQAILNMKLIRKSNFSVQGMFFNNCIEKNQNKTHFEEGSSSHTSLRDRSRYQIRWIFRKVSNSSWSPPTPTSQNGPHLWQSSACISYYLALVPSLIYLTISIIKYLQHNFPKLKGRGGGGEGRLDFFRKFTRFGAAILPLVFIVAEQIKLSLILQWKNRRQMSEKYTPVSNERDGCDWCCSCNF